MIFESMALMKRSEVERYVRAHARGASMPSGETLCRVLCEYPMVVSLEDLSLAPHLVMDGFWEMWVTICLAKQFGKHPSRKSWNSIDIGANFGYYTLLLAMLAPEGKVEAWEPQASLHAHLHKTLRLNGLGERVTLRALAAGAEQASGAYTANRNDRGSVSVRVGGAGQLVNIEPLTNASLERVDFVKIDAEGMEPEIWQGGIGILKPKAVLLEWSPQKYRDPPDFLSVIRRDGYSVSRINQHGDLELVEARPEETAKLSAIKGWEALWLERL